MAEFLYAKSVIWLFFLYYLRKGKKPMKGVPLICFEA